jgi:hypothetical protein
MISFWINSYGIRNRVFIPKYYDPKIESRLHAIRQTHIVTTLASLEQQGAISASTGHEIGKEAYGTGSIPFVRTSDISNWEIKTVPKQGISEEIFDEYAERQDVQEKDILFVRDGTYLIGTNCFVTSADKEMLYQSHILKFRVEDDDVVPPEILFLAFNSPVVQAQIRSFQFTADIIDTIGRRYKEIQIPIIRDKVTSARLAVEVKSALEKRVIGKAVIKQAPLLIEACLKLGTTAPFDEFLSLDENGLRAALVSDTVTLEFGGFEATFVRSSSIQSNIYLPKYYDPEIISELDELSASCEIVSITDLVDRELIEVQTGHEVGKLAYGTGEIPFLRTSDFANWEIKHDPKQLVGQEFFDQYASKQDLSPYDILLVRDGTYLVGSSTIVQPTDVPALFCGGLYRIRSLDHDALDPYLLLGVLNSYIVKRQFRAKQFTRDVIDTLGKRLFEVHLPWPKDGRFRGQLADRIRAVVEERTLARDRLKLLSSQYAPLE